MRSASDYEFGTIFYDLFHFGNKVSPRGQLVTEIENYQYELSPYVRFCNFTCRKLNLNYIKREFLWYLRGDRFDTSITDHAKMWKSLVNQDGSINSNYGQYVFGTANQFDLAANTLKEDKDSRRASIMILNNQHLASDTKDVPCTYAINFRIREDRLNMTVHMRSQDAIYGMGNDAPTFSFIHEMMLNVLREKYPDLEYGMYHHSADSFHVYERHFGMLAELANDEERVYKEVDCPKISGPEEVKFLRSLNFSDVPKNFEFSRWLTTFDEETNGR